MLAVAGGIGVEAQPAPTSRRGMADARRIAIARQTERMAFALSNCPMARSDMVAALVSGGVADFSMNRLRMLQQGDRLMSRDEARILGGLCGMDPDNLAPHHRDMPWLAPSRSVTSKATAALRRHDGRVPDESGDADEAPREVLSIDEAMARIAASIREDGPSDRPGREAADGPRTASPPVDGGHVLMSLSAVDGGVRFVYRGMMADWRREALVDLIGRGSKGADGLVSDGIVPGRAERLFRCDVTLEAAAAPRVIALLGSPGRRPGWWSRLVGRPRRPRSSASTG